MAGWFVAQEHDYRGRGFVWGRSLTWCRSLVCCTGLTRYRRCRICCLYRFCRPYRFCRLSLLYLLFLLRQEGGWTVKVQHCANTAGSVQVLSPVKFLFPTSHTGQGCQMTAGGLTAYGNAVRIYVKFLCMGPQIPDGRLHILDLGGKMFGAGHAIFYTGNNVSLPGQLYEKRRMSRLFHSDPAPAADPNQYRIFLLFCRMKRTDQIHPQGLIMKLGKPIGYIGKGNVLQDGQGFFLYFYRLFCSGLFHGYLFLLWPCYEKAFLRQHREIFTQAPAKFSLVTMLR